MKTLLCVGMTIGALWLTGARADPVQTNTALLGASTPTPELKAPLSAKPFLGTRSVLTLGGDYVNTPTEDYEMTGQLTAPLSLEDMHGMIAELGFGEATKQGEWQLRYRRKLMTLDPAWEAIADANHSYTLSDRRNQVLKVSYNLRDWWQLGAAALVEDRNSNDSGFDLAPLGLRNGESLGFQIDTMFKF